MLPSTGYFKTINCPFYDSGLCERPYCHFKHVKKGLKGKRDDVKELTTLENISPDAAELSTAAAQGISADSGSQEGGSGIEGKPPNAELIQKLVSEAVKKVLEHQNLLTSSASESTLVTKVVEELKPCTSKSEPPTPRGHKTYMPPVGIPSYKPTPISELKKRHIPVPYTPSASSRGGAKVQVKRGSSVDDNPRLKRVKSDEQVTDTVQEAEATRISGSSMREVSYCPSSLKYSPSHNGWSDSAKPLYVPSSIDTLPKCGNDYVPTHLSTPLHVPHYAPSEKCASSTEPNYEPEGSPFGSSSMVYEPTVKTELDEEDIGNIDLSTEFDLLDEILNENLDEGEKPSDEKKTEETDVVMGSPDTPRNKPKSESKDESKKNK